MNTIKLYRQYREVGTELAHKITESCLSPETITGAAKLLGILRGNQITLESEEEGTAVMDFTIHDYQANGKNAIAIYRDEVGAENQQEENLIAAQLSSYTSLFKVTETLRRENALILKDLLNDQENIQLTDISMSKTAPIGLLLFTRVIPLEEFNITSGSSFAFLEDQEIHLIKKQKSLAKKVKSDVEAIQRFVAFFKLNRTRGMNVAYR
jgi:hypothetical protein